MSKILKKNLKKFDAIAKIPSTCVQQKSNKFLFVNCNINFGLKTKKIYGTKKSKLKHYYGSKPVCRQKFDTKKCL